MFVSDILSQSLSNTLLKYVKIFNILNSIIELKVTFQKINLSSQISLVVAKDETSSFLNFKFIAIFTFKVTTNKPFTHMFLHGNIYCIEKLPKQLHC